MEAKEIAHILTAVLLMFAVSVFSFVFKGNFSRMLEVLVFSCIVVIIPVLFKKGSAYLLDSNVEHSLWGVYFYGYKPGKHFKEEKPFGILIPLALTVVTLGFFKTMTFLTYETRALKHRVAKRFGYYSYSEMTDWHNALIGSAGVISLFLIVIVSYILGFEYLSKLAAYYALFSILPISKLDGTQIFFGSRIIWTVLAFFSFLFSVYAFAL